MSASNHGNGAADARDCESNAHQIAPMNTASNCNVVPISCPHAEPSGELGANGPDVDACVRDAVDSLASRRQRAASGRWTTANTGALKAGLDSEQLWTALAPAKRAIVDQVRADHGVEGDDAAATLLGTFDGYAEVHLLRKSIWYRLTEGPNPGPVTGKGRTKALFTAYLSALDRELKLAQLIGLERRTRKVSPLDAIRAAVAEANQ